MTKTAAWLRSSTMMRKFASSGESVVIACYRAQGSAIAGS